MKYSKLNLDSIEKRITDSLENHLQNATEVYISVAYISEYFVEKYYEDLKNKKVNVITTTKDFVTDVNALKKLYELSNGKLYIYNDKLMHSKMIIFIYPNENIYYTIGSLNLTKNALCGNNVELNVIMKDDSRESLEQFKKIKANADISFRNRDDFDKFIKKYQKDKNDYDNIFTIHPRGMQSETLKNFKEKMKIWNKSILVAATGTGKTYMSAFAAQEYMNMYKGKLLFIVHNRTILRAAMRSYRYLFKDKQLLELKNDRDLNEINSNDLIFTTDIYGEKHINELLKYNFKFIIFDEVHRLGYTNQVKKINKKGENISKEINIDDVEKAEKYQYMTNIFKIFTRFKDKQEKIDNEIYLFGMTATPFRIHNNETINNIIDSQKFLISEVFEDKVLNRIPLEKAIFNKYITDFKYYGVPVNQLLNKSSKNEGEMKELINKALEKLDNIGIYDQNKKIKGLIFVNSLANASLLNDLINKSSRWGNKYKSEFIKGGINEESVEKIIEDLESDQDGTINFIVTVDKFNEGVDIPSLNTIIMMRPTKSQIIYRQQIGRGLRNIEGEDKYLTVIDMVGNDSSNWTSVGAITKKEIMLKDDCINAIIDKAKDDCHFYESDIDIEEIEYYKILKSLSIQSLDLDFLKSEIKTNLSFEEFNVDVIENILNLLKWDINKLRNTLVHKKLFSYETIPWLVQLEELIEEKDSMELTNEVKLENQFIERISWMTFTTSTIEDKKLLIELFTKGKAKLKIKWASYFDIKNLWKIVKNPKKEVPINKGHFFRNRDERFNWNYDTNTLFFNKNELSSRERKYLDIVIKLLENHLNENNYLVKKQLYTANEIMFMFGNICYSQKNDLPSFESEWKQNGEHDRYLFGTIDNTKEDGGEWVSFDYEKRILEQTFSRTNNLKFDKVNFIHMFVGNEKLNKHKDVKSFMYMGPVEPKVNKNERNDNVQRYIIDWDLSRYYKLLESTKKLLSDAIRHCDDRKY